VAPGAGGERGLQFQARVVGSGPYFVIISIRGAPVSIFGERSAYGRGRMIQ
jgi:hypothetical protein